MDACKSVRDPVLLSTVRVTKIPMEENVRIVLEDALTEREPKIDVTPAPSPMHVVENIIHPVVHQVINPICLP